MFVVLSVSVISQYRTEEDPFKKNEKKGKLLKETIPFYLNKFEQTVGENGGYAVGSTVCRSFVGFKIKIIFSLRIGKFRRSSEKFPSTCRVVHIKSPLSNKFKPSFSSFFVCI